MTELSLWLDYYDFLFELRNALKYKKERVFDLFLLLPEQKREEQSEKIIVKSLKDFFSEQLRINADKCRNKFHQGIILGVTGIIIMILNAFIGFSGAHSLPLVALKVILEPGGWFLLWASLDFLFYDWKELKKEREFFKELTEANIHFKSS